MARLVQKSGYIKNGSAGGYMKYIATREGVEKLHGTGQTTAAQKQLIQQLLSDFPDSADTFEYEDYQQSATFESASEFISTALDMNMHDLQSSEMYMKYIATRPRVQLRGEHGLFGQETSVNLPKTIEELNDHNGNVWTIIYSLRRSDAARLGYESSESWRNLIISHKAELAEAMKIDLSNFRWYAAFHNESHHPHIHMMVWSDNESQGFLTRDGIAKMRSVLTNDIFDEELHSLYVQKDVAYKELTATAQEVMQQLIFSMQERVCSNHLIEQKISELASALEHTTGKKQYGYLKKPLKEMVDSIVDELAANPEVARCYDVWHMTILQTAPPLKAESLNDGYKTLLEYNDTILAARPSRFGMQFVTWEWDFNHKGLNHGHYYNSNYEGAKRDFAVRAGLVEPQPIFNKEQLVEIYRCCEDTLCGVYEMTDEQRATIRSAQDRIRDKHPDILELIREQDELYEDAMYADPKEPELSGETEIDIMWDDLKPSTQRRIQAMLGDNGNYDVFPIATIQADQEMQQTM